jgi:hypothetical protein
MSGKQAKRYRRALRRFTDAAKIKAYNDLCALPFWERVRWALSIVFKREV